MNARRLGAALAVSCACLWPAQAISQQIYGPPEAAGISRASPAPARVAPDRLAPAADAAARPAAVSMIETWSLGRNAQLGLGRFRVMEVARPRSNVERVRDPLIMERETRPIAGAGINIRF